MIKNLKNFLLFTIIFISLAILIINDSLIKIGLTEKLNLIEKSIKNNVSLVSERIDKIRSINENPDYDITDFEGFDNKNGTDRYIVPNIVHLIYLQMTTIKFYQAVNIYSILLNQNPDLIYLHCDNCSFHGFYWEQINSIKELKQKIVIKKLEFHDTIFGKKQGWVHHR